MSNRFIVEGFSVDAKSPTQYRVIDGNRDVHWTCDTAEEASDQAKYMDAVFGTPVLKYLDAVFGTPVFQAISKALS